MSAPARTSAAPARPRAAIVLREPVAADASDFLAAVLRSRALHAGWVRPPASPSDFSALLLRLQQPDHQGHLVCCRAADGGSSALAGAIIVSNIVRGAFQSGYLGYYAFAGFAGRGLMQAGLRAAAHHAFRVLHLHRLEANIQPANTASLALVRACGFQREGFSPRYLKIGGRWRDHERWALIAPGS